MDFKPIQPDLVKFEMRMVKGTDPYEKAVKKPGAFGRFLSGIGKVLGAVAMPLSFIFPPAAIAAAGMYGVSKIGDQVQQRAYTKTMENAQRQSMTTVSYPGLNMGNQPIMPASGTFSAREEQVMNVLFKRDAAQMEMAHLL